MNSRSVVDPDQRDGTEGVNHPRTPDALGSVGRCTTDGADGNRLTQGIIRLNMAGNQYFAQ